MKIRIFQSDKGDCLLIETNDGRLILCDGGMSNSMKTDVAPALAKLRQQNRTIDLAYISHIDADHIAGVLELLRNEVDWRVYDFHQGTAGFKKPQVARPPAIANIWHNSFGAQLGDISKPIEDAVAAAAPAFLATREPQLQEVGEELYHIATSIPQAIEVSRLIGPELLKIPLNKLPNANGPAKLLMRRNGQQDVQIGAAQIKIIGPGKTELENLRKGWKTWLGTTEGEEAVKKVNKEIRKRIDDFSTGALDAIDLSKWNGIPDYKRVTAPNIASLMLFVREGNRTLLLTGDAQQEFIIDGLKKTGLMPNDSLHVDVLKVQHHGSENNLDVDFAAQVSADHYLFCGNGEHENPDLGV